MILSSGIPIKNVSIHSFQETPTSHGSCPEVHRLIFTQDLFEIQTSRSTWSRGTTHLRGGEVSGASFWVKIFQASGTDWLNLIQQNPHSLRTLPWKAALDLTNQTPIMPSAFNFAHISDLNLPKSINSQIELVQKNTFIEVVKSSIVCWISELLVPTFQLTKKCWLGFVPSASSAVQRGPALASFRYQRFHPGSSSLTQGNASHRSTNLFNTCCLANNPFPGPTSSFKMGQSFRWWMYTCKFQLLRVSENERQRLVYSGDSIQNFLSVRITSCSLSEPPSTIEVCVCVLESAR